MLSREYRHLVQMLKEARTIKITINVGASDELFYAYPLKTCRGDYRKLAHDIALAVQEYYNDIALAVQDRLNKG